MLQVRILPGQPTLVKGKDMMQRYHTLSHYCSGASYWDETPEGFQFWEQFREDIRDIPREFQIELIRALPPIENWTYKGPFDETYPPYHQLKIIAKYYQRFRTFIPLELFEELRK